MATAAAAIGSMPAADRGQAKMVFVTTHPAWDTPGIIQTWLSHFSSSFIGLTGTIAQIESAEATIGMPLSFAEKSTSPGSSYEIVHAGYVLVYTQSRAHLEFPPRSPPLKRLTTLFRWCGMDGSRDIWGEPTRHRSDPHFQSAGGCIVNFVEVEEEEEGEEGEESPPIDPPRRSFSLVRTQRTLQIILGLFWLLDAGLQFQPFMFGSGFSTTYLLNNAQNQPDVIRWIITNVGNFVGPHVAVWEYVLRAHSGGHRCRVALQAHRPPGSSGVVLLGIRCLVLRRGPRSDLHRIRLCSHGCA